MALNIRIDQDHLVVQSAHNQLLVSCLPNSELTRPITLPTSIETILLNSKMDLLAVLLVDRKWHFYRLSSTSKVNIEGSFESKSFQLAFLQLDALWLGQVTSSGLLWQVQHLWQNVHYDCTVELPQEYFPFQLAKYVHSLEQIVCVFHTDNGSVLSRFQVSPRLIEHISSRRLSDLTITKLELSNIDSRILLVTDDNVIHLFDSNFEAKWQVAVSLEIKSICFEPNFVGSFCVATDQMFFFLHYLPSDHQIALLEAIPNKATLSVIAYRAPSVFTISGNVVSILKLSQLDYLKKHQQIIIEMFSYDSKQFVKKLHNSDFSEPILWIVMAKWCLKQEDIQSAIYCAAKMGDARLARDLRREMAIRGHPNACALLALNLGLNGVAEELLSGEDTNALSEILQLQNKWNDAFLQTDKIQIKSAYYNYARNLEEENKITDAVKYYELSGNVLEVPRMLFGSGNISQLEEYCLKSHKNDKISSSLVTWWGQYCESQGDHKTAIDMYRSVSDYYNLVRLMCHVGQAEKAIQIVNEHLNSLSLATPPASSGKDMTAAILYLGKHLEALHSTESIHYYLHCGAVRHAIRVCIANELFDELATIAVEHCDLKEAKNILDTYCKPNSEMLSQQSLVKLYYKCSMPEEAIMIALHNHLWNQLRTICESELSSQSRHYIVSSQILDIALQALRSDTNIIDIVLDLILMSKADNFGMITQTIQDFGINLDDQLMDKLERYIASNDNYDLIDTFAELCLEKGNYQLAAKLYNKIGNRIDSLKALILAGNAEKVVQFANVARDKTVFKMAANFLQTVNYEDRSLIIKFYTKSEAFEELDRYKSEIASG